MFRRSLLLLVLVSAALLVCGVGTSHALNTSWSVKPKMYASSDYGKGFQVVAQTVRTRCGSTVQVRVFNGSSWKGWKTLDCSRKSNRDKGVRFSSPSVTVDRTNNKAFIVYMQASYFQPKRSALLMRVSSNRGRSWSRPITLTHLRQQMPQMVSASADRGVLWAAWQEARKVTDVRPKVSFAPFNQRGKQLRGSIVRGNSDRHGGLRAYAANGYATLFWTLKDAGSKQRWYAASSKPYKGAGNAARAALARRGVISGGKQDNMRRGDDGQVYRVLEEPCTRCLPVPLAIFTIQRWERRSHSFVDVARTSAPWTGVGDQAIAIGADRQGSIYLAYVDPTLAMDIDQDPCYARVDGMHWCARSSSPVPPPTYLYVEKFSAAGVSLGKVPLTFPFSSWSPAGATTIEFANHGRGAEGISSLLGGGVRLTAIIGHEDVTRQANPGSGVALTGVVTGPLF